MPPFAVIVSRPAVSSRTWAGVRRAAPGEPAAATASRILPTRSATRAGTFGFEVALGAAPAGPDSARTVIGTASARPAKTAVVRFGTVASRGSIDRGYSAYHPHRTLALAA